MAENNNDTVTMTVGELKTFEESVRTQAKVDELARFMANHNDDDIKRFDSMFNELRKIDADVRAIPHTLAKCQQELREESDAKFMSKETVEASFKTIKYIQIVAAAIVSILIIFQTGDRFRGSDAVKMRADLKQEIKQEIKNDMLRDMRKGG